jgi:hypothetical protein
MTAPLRILSLGAGVQSTALLLMTLDGELPPLDAAIFADTREEPVDVYRHLWWLAERCATAGLPLHIVSDPKSQGLTADLRDVLEGRRPPGIAQPPINFVGEAGRMQLRRQCTTHLKIQPIRRKVREIAGLTGRRSPDRPVVHQVIGISLDEAHRMRDTGEPWIVNEYPLVDRRMKRHDCLLWMERHGYPRPSRSACVMCPFRNTEDWRELRDSDPEGWKRAIEYDELVRDSGRAFGGKGMTGPAYVHFSAKPLADVDLSTEEDRGQGSLFGAECQGMCGV